MPTDEPTTIDVAGLRELYRATLKQPYAVELEDGGPLRLIRCPDTTDGGTEVVARMMYPHDALWYAAAHAAFPALLDELSRLRTIADPDALTTTYLMGGAAARADLRVALARVRELEAELAAAVQSPAAGLTTETR